uniref:Uncharacterized protein n=1 Tax=Rhizophora mucronata TaxID=61149 RepID=A0A2P2N6B8_RHIMU
MKSVAEIHVVDIILGLRQTPSRITGGEFLRSHEYISWQNSFNSSTIHLL